MDLKWVISEEERTRHDALFYSQKPQNRYLSGEQARSLFIRSKLPLPDLSKIWKLADISRNNMLDISEFAVAMHLIQSRLKGVDIPEKLPETLAPFHVPWLDIPVMLAEERKAYEKAFLWKDKDKTGYVDAETACSTLIGSQLPEEVLAKIWNLSDEDRDGKLSMDEFCVAIHLTRFCKKGNSLDGSVNVRSIVSQQWIEENFDGKKHRLTVVQTEKRRLLSLKEKLCHEIAGDLEEVAIAETIKTELNQVERDLYVLEKEENELRRTLQQIKDKSKRESFKPFDRSFLLKRQPSGADIFRGARKKNFASIVSEEDREIEKLWRVDDALTDFGATIKDTPLIPVNYNIRQDHFATVIELNQGQGSSESSGTTSPVPNGIGEDELEKESIHDLHPNSSDNEVSGKQEDSAEHTTTIDEVRERDRDVEILVDLSEHTTTHEVRERDRDVGILVDLAEHTTTHEVRESDRDVGILVDLAEHTTTTHEVRESERDVEFQDGEQTRVSSSEDTNNHLLLNGSSTPLDPQSSTDDQSPSPPEPTNMDSNFSSSSYKKQIHENNRTDDEKSGSRGQRDDLAKNGIGEEEDANTKGSSNHIRIPVTESVDIATAPTAQFVAASRIDDLFGQPGEDGGSVDTKTRTNLDANRNPETEYEGATSPRSVSQEELILNILEEKKKKDEERARQRQADDEMLQKARQEHLRRDQEIQREAEQRKVTFQEEKRRLEQQVTLVQEGHEPSKKAPLSRTEAGKFIEQELEEQRIREEITRMELEKIKEKEKIEMEKKKSKHVKKDEHPLVYRNKDVVQKPIFEEANDTETLEPQVSGLAAKRGSIIDLNEGVGTMSKVVTKPVESRQEHVYTQPVIRRTHENAKPLAGRKAENRKSFVELEIERQKEREEEARREAENARRIQAQRSSAGNVISKSAVELDRERQKEREKAEAKEMEVRRGREISGTLDLGGRKAVLKKQLEVETVVRQENTTTVESSPSLDEIDANEKKGDDISQLKKVKEEQQEELRRKEKEYLKQMQEEERKRREAEKEELDKLRKEVEMREAQELMRLKLVREEERNKKREAELKEAAKRKKEEQEKKEEIEHGTVFRKTAFAAHKLILEQRVLKALEETKQEATVPKRRSSSFERQTEYFTQTESLPSQQQQQQQQQPEAGEDVPVKLRRAAFEKSGTTTESREELRKKRYSLNLDHASRAMNAREDVVLRNKHPGQPVGKKDRASFYADDIVAKESQAQLEREEELLRRVGAKPQPSDGKMTKAKSLGDVSFKKEQIGDQTPYQIVRKISLNEDETDSGFTSKDGLPVFADSRIQRELEEQRRREEVLRKEATEREKRYRLEGEKKKASEASSSSGTKDVSLNEIKRNPLPNKIQVKKPQASNRDSLTQSMAAHWETVLHTQDGGDTKKASNVEKKERKTSFIELEKEVERRREEELQKEREQGLLEKRRNEEEKKLTKQRKIEEELEKKRKVKEEKEKRQQRTLAMKSIFEKMGDKK